MNICHLFKFFQIPQRCFFIVPLAILCLMCIYVLSCSTKSGSLKTIEITTISKTASYNVNFSTPTITSNIVLFDDSVQIQDIRLCKALGKDSILIVDSKRSILLFVGGKYIKKIGNCGGGGNEYRSIHSLTVSGDTLFILDSDNSSIIGYSLLFNHVVYRIQNPKIFLLDVITRNSNGEFILVDRQIPAAQHLDRQTNVFYQLNSNSLRNPTEQLLPIEFCLSNITPPKLSLPVIDRDLPNVLSWSTNEQELCVAFPYCSKVVFVEPTTPSFRILETDILVQRNDKAASQKNDFELLSNSETIEGVFTLKNCIAFVAKRRGDYRILFYKFDNSNAIEFLGNLNIPQNSSYTMYQILDVTESSFTVLCATKKIEKHPFCVIRYTFSSQS